jgi:hypothetical protein
LRARTSAAAPTCVVILRACATAGALAETLAARLSSHADCVALMPKIGEATRRFAWVGRVGADHGTFRNPWGGGAGFSDNAAATRLFIDPRPR